MKKNNKVLNGAELLNMSILKIPTLIDPIIPKVGLIALIGTSDIGKSRFLLQLCNNIALEDKFLDFNINALHKSTIYVSTEDDQYSISFRIQSLKGCDQEKLKNTRYIFNTEDLLKVIDAELTKQKADIVAIDTFADIYDGEMNQINKVRSFMHEYHSIALKHQCVIIFNHHTGKYTEEKPPSKNNSIGSAGFEGKARLVMELRPDYGDDAKRHLCIVKGNYLGPEYKSSSFELDFDLATGFKRTGGRKEYHELIRPKLFKPFANRDVEKKLVERLHKKGKSARLTEAILKRLGYSISKTTVSEWVKNMSGQK